jgi:hypothetical protein
MFSLIGREQKKAIIEKYDKKSLFLFFKSVIIIYILWLNLKGDVVDQKVEKYNNLDYL